MNGRSWDGTVAKANTSQSGKVKSWRTQSKRLWCLIFEPVNLRVGPSLGHNLECQAHAEPALARSRDETEASRSVNDRLV